MTVTIVRGDSTLAEERATGRVSSAEYFDGYRVRLTFSDSRVKTVGLESMLTYGMHEDDADQSAPSGRAADVLRSRDSFLY